MVIKVEEYAQSANNNARFYELINNKVRIVTHVDAVFDGQTLIKRYSLL